MSHRRRRRRRIEGAAVLRVLTIFARVGLVILVSAAIGYAFYYGLRWVAAEAEGRGSASLTSLAVLAREGR